MSNDTTRSAGWDSSHAQGRGRGRGIDRHTRGRWLGAVMGLLMIGPGLAVAGPSGEGVVDLRFGPVDPAVAEGRSGDLRVMARVVERAVRPPGRDTPVGFGMGIPLWLGRGQTEGVRAMYLEGFGALFSLTVDQPLTPGRGGANPAERGPTGSAWDAARRELEGGPAEEPLGEPAAKYDAAWVAKLQEQLVAVMRQATNIRHLAPGEAVALVVEGPEAGSGADPGSVGGVSEGDEDGGVGGEGAVSGGVTRDPSGANGAFVVRYGGTSSAAPGVGVGPGSPGGGGGSVAVYGSGGGGTVRRSFRWRFGGGGGGDSAAIFGEPSGSGAEGLSVLTLRVSKADLDALASGGLTAEAWAGRVRVNAYPSRAPGLNGGRRIGF